MEPQKGQKRAPIKKVDEKPITGVDLTTKERLVTEETEEERSRKKTEEELQEWKDRKKFLVTQPPVFEGVMDPIVVHNWTREMENAFEICKCLESRKVLYASFMLRGEALFWWDTCGKEASTSMSWDQFKELVYKRFCPKNLVYRMERIFLKLKQGDMSVLEYAAKFTQYARFTNFVLDENLKIRMFSDGLNTELKHLIIAYAKTFEEAVDRALGTENCVMEEEEDIKRKMEEDEEDRKRQMEEEVERRWDGRQARFKKFRTRW